MEENTSQAPSSYAEAVAQLNALVARLERESINLEDIDSILQRADTLICYCRGRLYETKEHVDRAIAGWNTSGDAPQSEE